MPIDASPHLAEYNKDYDMDVQLEREIEFLCEDLFEGGRNHVLLYGKPERTLPVLQGVYERAKKREEFLCSWHDASKITQPMDFFEPILRLKYGSEYESLREKSWFKELAVRDNKDGVFQLARFCGREKDSKNPHLRKLPLIFIKGIEELFFTMDYGHLDEEGRKKLMNYFTPFTELPLPKGFGDCLRGYLHQTGNGICYGSVMNTKRMEVAATLLNYQYLFYGENFRDHAV